jgi:hypothetical protein
VYKVNSRTHVPRRHSPAYFSIYNPVSVSSVLCKPSLEALNPLIGCVLNRLLVGPRFGPFQSGTSSEAPSAASADFLAAVSARGGQGTAGAMGMASGSVRNE